jgi:hypothetical protein
MLISAAAAIVQGAMGTSLRGPAFASTAMGTMALAGLFAAARSLSGRRIAWPDFDRRARWTIVSMLAFPFLLVAALTPKIYWEAFNGDGAHAFEATRLLLVQNVPFFPSDAGDISGFPGLTSMLFAFPASWFVRLFGELEASVRLPFFLYLPVLFAAVVAVIEAGRREVLQVPERLTVWLGITTYAVALAFSATYNPYSADIALPATQDTLLMACFLGFVLAFIRNERGWMLLFAWLTYVSLPSGLLLMGFWVAAAFVTARVDYRREIARATLAILVCVVGGVLVSNLLPALGASPPGSEYGAAGFLRYFAFLQFTDVRRLLYVAIPAGILPVAALALWKRQDPPARVVSLVTAGYFLLFYVQAHVSLHHFVPAMLLPIVVLWRIVPGHGRERRVWLGAATVAGLFGLALSLPPNARVDTSAREVGASIEDRTGGYEHSAPGQFAASELLAELFPVDWDPSVPERAYGGSPVAWNYYARHEARQEPARPLASTNYVLLPSDSPPPPEARLVASRPNAALYVLSDEVWKAHLALRPPSPAGSRWLAVPRSTLFRSVPAGDGPMVFDVVAILEDLGIDVSVILRRLGVER